MSIIDDSGWILLFTINTWNAKSVRIAKVMIKNSNVVDFSFRAEDEYPVNFIVNKLLNLRLIFYDDFFYTMELKEREST